jgi:hypothetical protein
LPADLPWIRTNQLGFLASLEMTKLEIPAFYEGINFEFSAFF